MDYYKTVDKTVLSFLTYIKKAIDTKSYSDKTFTAKIADQAGPGKYKVLYCGNYYTVSSIIPCKNEDMVRVCAPCNNWQDLFVVQNIMR